MISIQQWFDEGCDYKTGVSLYELHPKSNKNIARLLNRKQSSVNHEKLKYELKKLSSENVLVRPKAVSIKVQTTPPPKKRYIEPKSVIEDKKRVVFFHQLPESLRPKLLEANNLFKECCMLKVELNELPDEAEQKALELQLKISEKRKKNELCWKHIDYWLEHKMIPNISNCEFENLTPAELWKKDQYIFQNISKLKKRLDENKAKLNSDINQKEKNRLIRLISKQEASIIKKEEQQSKIKDLIHGR